MNITKKTKLFELTISQKFNEQTKISKRHNLKEIPVNEWPEDWKTVHFKGYPRFRAVKLSKPLLNDRISFKDAIFKRHSWRNFSGKPMSEKKLSSLLYFFAGIREQNSEWSGNRFYPSAGARYPLEIYPIIININGVRSGIYHYYIKNHLLEILPEKPNYKNLAFKYFGNQPWVNRANLLLIISSIFHRTNVKYGERGYRHVLTELGCMLQNIYLTCAVLDIGCCPTGGYVDDGYNELLDLDGIEESVIGAVAIGEKKSNLWRI